MRFLRARLRIAQAIGLGNLRARQDEIERRQRDQVEALTARLHAAAAAQARAVQFIDERLDGGDFRAWLLEQPTYAGRIELGDGGLPADMLLGTGNDEVWAFRTEEEALRWWALTGRQVWRVHLSVVEHLAGVRWKERAA